MRAVHAVRGALLVVGLLGVSVASGCCACSQSLWKGDKSPSATPAAGQTNAIAGNKDPQDVLNNRRRGANGFDDQPHHLTPERIQGGIY